MPAVVRTLLKRLRRRLRAPGGATFIYALAAQGLILALTLVVAVFKPVKKPEPTFVAATTLHLPQRELDHRMALAEFQRAAGGSVPLEKLSVAALLPDGLPPLPAAPQADAARTDSSQAWVMDGQNFAAQFGLAGLFSGSGSAGQASFFGVQDSGQRIVVVVNTSASVVRKARNRGVTIARIQEEIIALVDGLDSRTLFGVVQFSQGARTFAEFLAPATESNRSLLRAWVPDNLRGNPATPREAPYFGHEAAFDLAFKMDPEIIFLLTDGQLNRRTGTPGNYSYPEISYDELAGRLRAFQRGRAGNVRIHVIGFEMKHEDIEKMRRLTRDFRGTLREF